MKIEFLINDRGELYDFKTSEEEEKIEEFRIPSIVNGVKVESIGDLRDTFRNLYAHGVKQIKKLIIENGVEKIEEYAFARIKIGIGTFHWPKTCLTISVGCFYNSNIECVKNVQDVIGICRKAFQCSGLRSITWPPKCKRIPDSCFAWSTIETLIGIENVEKSEFDAFYCTQLKRFSWPAKCKVIPEECFYGCQELEQIEGIEEVTNISSRAFQGTAIKKYLWPARVSATKNEEFLINCNHLEEIIFGGGGIKDVDLECLSYLKDVKKIDLSKCGAVNLINCSSPKGRKLRDKVVLPYYVTEIN